ncbi:hypothetical protein ISN45_Aa02g016570 [Arabidopsis thaliana x Arabidopsis arenosa]|uniref:RING-type domain-containing protein n=1 Tax=Arabidopsis thaliana x Arabidopsis arenosa TaxID=1240361 RepID=A0A8T2BGA1_9BRAS|nr:hypothetical protein ISN45_Aa02g016570 [Arabidopsis thaliana x Arabidopsis arenosa]
MEAYRSGLVAHPKRSLAGKFFTSLRPPSFDRTEIRLRQQWKLSRGFKVFAFEKDDIILFEFEKKRDKNKVVKDGHWNVDGIILVLKEFPHDISIADIDFSVACFRVKVIGLPYFCYTEEDVDKIGKKLSDKPWISFKYNTVTRCFWVKAEINLKQPLPPGLTIGKGRRRQFVQFKYKNLGDFCEHCGMISHRKCEKVAEQRALTRKFKTHVYGPWLRYDPEPDGKGLPVKSHYSQSYDDMGLPYEETLTYAQFKVEVRVDVVYASEHEWGGKKLIRSLVLSEYVYFFRFPCSPTRFIKDVLEFEVDKISHLARLTAEDKAIIVHGLVDHLMKQRNAWSKQRWVPLLVHVEKTIMVPPVDMETMLQEAKDKKLQETIEEVILKLVDGRLKKSDDLLMRTIQDGIGEVGLTHQVPDVYIEKMIRWVKKTNKFLARAFKIRLHPDNKCVTVLGPDMDLFGTCCVCQDDFFLGEEATLTYPCSHAFHTCCIQDWILQSQKCPLCRLQLQMLSSL